MAITTAELTNGSNATTQASYSTASISPTPNSLVFFGGNFRNNSGSASVSGCSLTWNNIIATNGETQLWMGKSSSPSTGAITISNLSGAGQGLWIVAEFYNVNVVRGNVQSNVASGSSTTALVTLGTFSNAKNATFGFGSRSAAATITAGSGFTMIRYTSGTGLPNGRTVWMEWKDTNDTTVDATISSSGGWTIAGVELEHNIIKNVENTLINSARKIIGTVRTDVNKVIKTG